MPEPLVLLPPLIHQIVLLSADSVGTNEIMRAAGKAKTCVWRWQQRFMEAGVGWIAGRQDAPVAR